MNEYLQTTAERIYAAGDVKQSPVRILSAHIVGPHADDLIHELAIA
jgi:pyruvate/2-oxoglutarate dehydrogenase complex dihydrolipoamide dehydrogenase (E3) component